MSLLRFSSSYSILKLINLFISISILFSFYKKYEIFENKIVILIFEVRKSVGNSKNEINFKRGASFE